MSLNCVILAAGLGKRMKSSIPKVLHRVYGVPMLQSVINTARRLKPKKIVIVVGKQRRLIERTLDSKDLLFAFQKEAKGTAHALRCAGSALENRKDAVIVLNGDTPLLNSVTLKRFLSLHRRNKNAISVLSFIAGNPDGYGRIVRHSSGRVLSIIEHNDTDPAQKKIKEVNSGVYALNHSVFDILDEIEVNQRKNEFYLTDIVSLSSKMGLRTAVYCMGSEDEFMGVNTREELYRASHLMKEAVIHKWISKGVLFVDSGLVFIHPDVSIGRGTTIYPNVYLEGHTRIGKGSVIYPNVRILDSDVGNDVVIKDSSVIEASRIRNGASVGPFARIRPGSEVGAGARIGNFVELKKAVVGKGSKASHLSYLGDTRIGKGVNIGAGTITCNYDGVMKHRTVIEDGVFVGSDTQLVAPVKVGKGAYIGAGSTITRDVPPWDLALSRPKQVHCKGWAKKMSTKSKKGK